MMQEGLKERVNLSNFLNLSDFQNVILKGLKVGFGVQQELYLNSGSDALHPDPE